MNYQQAFSHVTVLLPIDPGKLKHRKTRVVLYVAPTSIATPPWIGCWHPVIHLGEETNGVEFLYNKALAMLEPKPK